MALSTKETLDAVLITHEERKALAALLYSGLTGDALERLGLKGLQERLSEAYEGYWETGSGLDGHPALADYGVNEWVSPDGTQRTRNCIQ